MGVLDLTSVAAVKRWMGAAVSPAWTAGVTYSLGAFIVDPALHTQRVITPGAAGGTIPTFNDAGGVTTEGPSTPPLQWQDEGFADDQMVQDCITAFSLYVMRATGRGNADGSIPPGSPFVSPQSYNEWYDGNGQRKLYLHNWPITGVTLVTVETIAIPQSTGISTPGWTIDQQGRSIALRGSNPNNVPIGGGRGRGREWYRCGYRFALGEQNVNVAYTAGFSGVPFDLEMAARKTVALNFKRTGWIGQKSQAMAQGAGTVQYGDWEMDIDCERTLLYYRRFSF